MFTKPSVINYNDSVVSVIARGGNYPISKTTAHPGLKKRKLMLYRIHLNMKENNYCFLQNVKIEEWHNKIYTC